MDGILYISRVFRDRTNSTVSETYCGVRFNNTGAEYYMLQNNNSNEAVRRDALITIDSFEYIFVLHSAVQKKKKYTFHTRTYVISCVRTFLLPKTAVPKLFVFKPPKE